MNNEDRGNSHARPQKTILPLYWDEKMQREQLRAYENGIETKN